MSKTISIEITNKQEAELLANVAGCNDLSDVIQKFLPYQSQKPDVLTNKKQHQTLLHIVRTYSPESLARTVVYALKTSEKQTFIEALLRYQNGTYHI